MKGTHKFVIGSLVLASCTLPRAAAGEKIDYEPINTIRQRGLNPPTIAASFAYPAANRDERLPRKPLPAPAAGRGRAQ
jgi:hypothetical protein